MPAARSPRGRPWRFSLIARLCVRTLVTPMLEIAGLSVAYGKHPALADVALNVAAGEIVAILGANGAGKTTLLKAIAGLVRPRNNAGYAPLVRFNGRDLLALEPFRIVEAGVALVP